MSFLYFVMWVLYVQAEAEAVNRAGVLKPWYADEQFSGSHFSLEMQLPDYAISLIKFTKIR